MTTHDLNDKCYECEHKKREEHLIDVITSALLLLRHGSILGAVLMLGKEIKGNKCEPTT